MLCLGIETSCDETGLALIDEEGIRASILSTQIDIHALFGGVVPEIASREHAKLLPVLFDTLIQNADISLTDIKGVAVSNGPGLLGALLVGLGFAKGLCLGMDYPLIGVNHLHAHLSAVGIENKVQYPALGVLVSGGHTHLYKINSNTEYTVLGRTLDDAAGEACDKFAKMLTLPYPGGALLDMLGKQGNVNKKLFPRPYTKNHSLDFSFSGLKTAAQLFLAHNLDAKLPAAPQDAGVISLAEHKERISNAPQILSDAAASYLFAIADTLAIKAEEALTLFKPNSLILAGGVAANSFVRAMLSEFAKKHDLNFYVPSLKLCTDNAEMVAYLGREMLMQGQSSPLSLHAYARGTKE